MSDENERSVASTGSVDEPLTPVQSAYLEWEADCKACGFSGWNSAVSMSAFIAGMIFGKRGTLTGEEREAISEAVLAFEEFDGDEVYIRTLRGLLERLK